MDDLLNKHFCFNYCFCEGRTGNGIELINAYSSFFYILPAIFMLLHPTYKPNTHTYWLSFLLVSLAISSFYFHYYMHILGSHCDNLSILLILVSFIFNRYSIINTIFIYIAIFISLYLLKQLNVLLTIFVIVYFIYYFYKTAKKHHKINRLFYQINLLFILSVCLWIHDYNFDYICVHWLWHILTAILFYLLYVWFRTIH